MKCKGCKIKLPVRHGVYCDECLKKFSVTHAKAKEERQQNKIQCKICGKYFVLLASHTFAMHKLTGRQYRKMFGYDIKKGLIPEHYRQARQALNKRLCIYKNLKGKGAPLFKKGHTSNYKRGPETVGRLMKQFDGVDHASEETRKKLSEARKGKHHTKETKRKMSEVRKKYWERQHKK